MIGINIGYALVYECIIIMTTIYPNPTLLDSAATSVSRLIRSDSNNLKYIGLKGLTYIVRDHPIYVRDHQLAVIDCLEDTDITIQHKTLDLLFRMTNKMNVEVVVQRLLTSLGACVTAGSVTAVGVTDEHFRGELVGMVTQCAERFAPSNSW